LKNEVNKAGGAKVASEAERTISMRRASGFNQAFEAALIKETEGGEMVIDGAATDAGESAKRRGKRRETETEQRAEAFRRKSERELERLQDKPNLKWTSGVSLELEDLFGLVRAADRRLQLPHSGYDDSLNSGSLRPDSKGRVKADLKKGNAPFLDLSPTCLRPVPELSDSEAPVVFDLPPLNRRADTIECAPIPITSCPTWLFPVPPNYVLLPTTAAPAPAPAVTLQTCGTPVSIHSDNDFWPEIIEILSSGEESRVAQPPPPKIPFSIQSDGGFVAEDTLDSVAEVYVPEDGDFYVPSESEEEDEPGQLYVLSESEGEDRDLYVPSGTEEP
jgi:hypothetical protein